MITNAQEIRNSGNCYDILQNYLDLKREGRYYVACCPLHGEKTPSFKIDTSKNNWHCYGCGEGGDAVHFLIEHEGLTYPEALIKVASLSNIQVQYDKTVNREQWKEEEKEAKAKKEALYPLADWASNKFFEYGKNHFEESTIKIDQEKLDGLSCQGRVYTPQIIEKFKLGFVPGKNFLLKAAEKEQWNIELLKDLKLILDGQHGEFDFFRNRLIFPIHNHQGKVVAWAGRTSKSKDQEPKYINSPETFLYKKKGILYGLHQSKRAIRQAGYALLYEGYTDVITSHQFGIENTVASCGTALTVEQVQLLKRFCQKVVVVRDGDKAGMDATIKDVEILIEAGFHVDVCVIPPDKKTKEGEDPDSFLRKHGKRAFETFLEEMASEGLVWRVMLDFKKGDSYSLTTAINTAAKLLHKVKSEIRRDVYLGELTKTKHLGARRRLIEKRIQEIETEQYKKFNRKDGLTTIQERDLELYGIYIKNNGKGSVFYKKVFKGKERHVPLTNFVIIPVYHINSIDSPAKIIVIRNEHGLSKTIELHTNFFFNYSDFKKKIGEYGNYRFLSSCKTEDFDRIMAKVIEESTECYKINTLGWHLKGYYTWNNGITLPDGVYQPCTENGLVEYEDIKYILPGRQVKNKNDDAYDDDTSDNLYIQLFAYKPASISVEQWLEKFIGVYGENGLMGSAFFFAALYRDYIYSLFKWFPILNPFGPPEKGKSVFCRSLSTMFGKPRPGMDLSDFTVPGFRARTRQVRNGLIWGDEFKNEMEDKKHFLFKSVYDGQGKEKRSDISNSSKTTKSEHAHSAFVLSGEDLPTRHISLLTRCITLLFEYKHNDEAEKRFDELRAIEESGQLSGITGQLMKYRDLVIDKFTFVFDEVRASIRSKVDRSISPRIINNYCAVLAVARIITEQIDAPLYNGIPYYQALEKFTVKSVIRQAGYVQKQDEVSEFWRAFIFYIREGKLKHDKDFRVDMKSGIRVRIKDTRRDTQYIQFEEKKKVLFLNFEMSHAYYSKYMSERRLTGRNLPGIQRYMELSQPFIGEVRGKKFDKNSKTLSCYAFYCDKLEAFFDLPLTKEALEDDNGSIDDNCPECGKPKPDCNCLETGSTDDLPF